MSSWRGLVLGLLAVEEQEWIDEQGQVRDNTDVEGAVLVEDIGVHAETVREVQLRHETPTRADSPRKT